MPDSLTAGFDRPDEIPLDEQGRIAADVMCLVCGYNLRTQSIHGRCPECGTAVGRSAHGDLLRYCEPGWVETLSSGMNWIVAGLVAGVILRVSGSIVAAVATAQGKSASSPNDIMDAVASIISMVGYWKLTTPDPGKPDDVGSLNPRFVARWNQVGGVVLVLASAALSLSKEDTEMYRLVLGLMASTVGLVAIAAEFTYVRQLALRIPDERLAASTKIVMWGLLVSLALMVPIILSAMGSVARQGSMAGSSGATVAAACVGFVGLAVFGIWSLVLIVRYRRAFALAAQDARSTWAASAADR